MRRAAGQLEREQTLVLIKPDGVMRGLVGQILERFERLGLKIVAVKMAKASRSRIERHLPKSEEWLIGIGTNTLESYRRRGRETLKIFGTRDPKKIGAQIKERIYSYLTAGPLVAAVIEGPYAIEVVRKLVGHTLPYLANPGTIRGDFSLESPELADLRGSPCLNLVHASSSKEEAWREISCWFASHEIVSVRRSDNPAVIFCGENIRPANRRRSRK